DLYMPKTNEDTEKLFALIDRTLSKLSRHQEDDAEEKIGYKYVKKSSGIHWDLVYRKRETEIGTRNKYLQNKSKEANMEIPLNTKLFSMIFEIEQGKRKLGWHNLEEMNEYINELGFQLP
ncbi:MAG: 2-dehydropantoate 2-reductase, partial [Bacillota bacterium]|nr:2-dehydropantoate 2-reductase [Bacillota bacterium]